MQAPFGGHFAKRGRVILYSLLLTLFYWLEEGLLSLLFDDADSLHHAFWPEHTSELVQRGFIFVLLLLGGLLLQRHLDRQNRITRQLGGLMENSRDAFITVDADWTITYCSEQTSVLLNSSVDPAGRHLTEMLPSETNDTLLRILDNQRHEEFEAPFPILNAYYLFSCHPTESGMALYIRDVTVNHQRELALRQDQHKLQLMLESTVDGIVTINARGEIETFNRAAEEMFGYNLEEIRGCNVSILMPTDQAGQHDSYILNYLESGKSHVIDVGSRLLVARRKNGSQFPVDITISRMEIGEQSYFIGLLRDVSGRTIASDKLDFMTGHDPLTGLPNRNLLLDRIDSALHRAHRNKGRLALLFIDIDRFKGINDTLGHQLGDDLLITVGKRLMALMPEGDTVARIGGDEFVVLLEGVSEIDRPALHAQQIHDTFHHTLTQRGHEIYLGVSIGIALYPDDAQSAEHLLRNAESAMVRAKQAGSNSTQYFTADMTQHAQQRMQLEQDLHRAFAHNEFRLYYQPQVELKEGKVVGVEALLRWHHPELGVIAPMAFIPLQEETGLVLKSDEFVLRCACRDAWQIQQTAGRNLRIAVNLSGLQFHQANLVPLVDSVLQEYPLEPACLEIEITEGVLVEEGETAVRNLTALRDMGLQLAIDDFGTGYSAMSYLRRFPVHSLKIDRTFIGELGKSAHGNAIVSAVITLAHQLGLKVIAEGVETEQQLAILRELDCDLAQGYLFSRALELENLHDWLESYQPQLPEVTEQAS